ncbi:MAG: tRNA (adenosine(37)-N6)-threonylcarbamoyltransferase complex transferase subunit TsaD [Deltaproteobacteria bacterium]|nr:tRNA (adenosine(37)-N6)-threonylcarbamoyltransferase complex transferase subunit TsaD [Deltaproteobacteria bacterium]
MARHITGTNPLTTETSVSMDTQTGFIIGVDTSCDDTSVAVLEERTGCVLSNIVSSQIKIHQGFGGIVPELASRSHMENIAFVFAQALESAGINIQQITRVAVTNTPGLVGCLLVGTGFARALAYQLGVPLHGVNHLEGHLFSPFITEPPLFPCLGLVVSGGHTAFYRIASFEHVTLLGQTVDDAAGEAFDKCAKMLCLGYPGGPVIDQRAGRGDQNAFPFTVARVKMGREYLSFSGLKTAAYHHIRVFGDLSEQTLNNLCASIQKGIVDALMDKAAFFFTRHRFKSFAVSGGVAMNSLLRTRSLEIADRFNVKCCIARPDYCTDNGAMIAHVAHVRQLDDQLFTLGTEATKKIQARKLACKKKQ